MSSLHDVIKENLCFSRVERLLGEGQDPNGRDVFGNTPLHFAAMRNERRFDVKQSLQLIDILIEYGADVNAVNNIQMCEKTPLIYAVKSRNCQIAEHLLEKTADVDLRDTDGNTALLHVTRQCGSSLQNAYKAFQDPDLHLVRTLLQYEPEIDIHNVHDEFPLMMAVKNQHLPIVLELLKKYASVDYIIPMSSPSAIFFALLANNFNQDIVLELMRYECRIDIHAQYNFSPMGAYMNKLIINPTDEEEAKYVFKLFLFRNYTLTPDDNRDIEMLSRHRFRQLSQFIQDCQNEISLMRSDTISSNNSFYDIVLRIFYHRTNPQVTEDDIRLVLNKLIRSEYPVYCDAILSIISEYVKDRILETTDYLVKSENFRLNRDEMHSLSSYLSNFDRFNVIAAYSEDR